MAGPTVLDLPIVTDVLDDDVFYLIRGVGAGRDRQVAGKYVKGGYDLVISSQAEFEWWFGTGNDEATGVTGTTQGGWVCVDVADDETVTVPANISILIMSNPADGVTTHFKYDAANYIVEAYELNTRIQLSTGITIHGEGIDQTIIIRNTTDNYPMFITSALETEAVTGVATNDFTVASSTNFNEGQTIEHSNDNTFYKVISVPDGTSVLVDRTITGAAAGNITVCQDSIELKDFTFDGRCNVDGLGGTRTNQAFNLSYCAHSNFEAKVINCKDTNGGAYESTGLVYRLKISNVFHCEGTTAGGACYRCSYSEISNIYNCLSADGGACYTCDYSVITEIHNCQATARGGACFGCDYSIIKEIYNCSVTAIGGGFAYGGGVYTSHYCTISNIYNCSCTSTTGQASGGGCYSCDNSTISNIYNCSCASTSGVTTGGGCYGCDDGTISNIHDCTVDNTDNDATGGGASTCDKVCILGNYTGNLSEAGAGVTDTFAAMTNYCNNFIFDGAADQNAAAGPTDWD